MKTLQTEDEVIQEFRESKKHIRERIAEYEDAERRLFKRMLDKINEIDNYSPEDYFGSEQYGSLD